MEGHARTWFTPKQKAELRPKPCRLARHAELRWRVAHKLVLQWSPEQISGWLKRQFPAAPGMQVSHETIYRSLFIQTRGVLKKALMAHLRTTRQMRQAKGGTTKSGLGQIVDAASIRERPAEADDRGRCGSINARGRPWASKPLPIDYEQCCSDQLNPHPKADISVLTS